MDMQNSLLHQSFFQFPERSLLDPEDLLTKDPKEMGQQWIASLLQEGDFSRFSQQQLNAFSKRVVDVEEILESGQERALLSFKVLVLALERLPIGSTERIQINLKQYGYLASKYKTWGDARSVELIHEKLQRNIEVLFSEKEKETLHMLAKEERIPLVYSGLSDLQTFEKVLELDRMSTRCIVSLLKNKQIDLVKFLLDAGSDVHRTYDGKWLFSIVLRGVINGTYSEEVIDLFFQKGASFFSANPEIQHPIYSVIDSTKPCVKNIFNKCLKMGLDVNFVQQDGTPFAHELVKIKNCSLFPLAVDFIQNLNVKDPVGRSLLGLALELGKEKLTKCLLGQSRLLLDQPEGDGSLPWHNILKTHNSVFIKLFLLNSKTNDFALDIDIEDNGDVYDTLTYVMTFLDKKSREILLQKIKYQPARHFRVLEQLATTRARLGETHKDLESRKRAFHEVLKWAKKELTPSGVPFGNVLAVALAEGDKQIVKEITHLIGVSQREEPQKKLTSLFLQPSSGGYFPFSYFEMASREEFVFLLSYLSKSLESQNVAQVKDQQGDTLLHGLIKGIRKHGETPEALHVLKTLLERLEGCWVKNKKGESPIEIAYTSSLKGCLTTFCRYLEEEVLNVIFDYQFFIDFLEVSGVQGDLNQLAAEYKKSLSGKACITMQDFSEFLKKQGKPPLDESLSYMKFLKENASPLFSDENIYLYAICLGEFAQSEVYLDLLKQQMKELYLPCFPPTKDKDLFVSFVDTMSFVELQKRLLPSVDPLSLLNMFYKPSENSFLINPDFIEKTAIIVQEMSSDSSAEKRETRVSFQNEEESVTANSAAEGSASKTTTAKGSSLQRIEIKELSWMNKENFPNEFHRKSIHNFWNCFVEHKLGQKPSPDEIDALVQLYEGSTVDYFKSVAEWHDMLRGVESKGVESLDQEQIDRILAAAKTICLSLSIKNREGQSIPFEKFAIVTKDRDGIQYSKTYKELYDLFETRLKQYDLDSLEHVVQEAMHLVSMLQQKQCNQGSFLEKIYKIIEILENKDLKLDLVKSLRGFIERSESRSDVTIEEWQGALELLRKFIDVHNMRPSIKKLAKMVAAMERGDVDPDEKLSFFRDVVRSSLKCIKKAQDEVFAHFSIMCSNEVVEKSSFVGRLYEFVHALRLSYVDKLVAKYNDFPGNETHTRALFAFRLKEKGLFPSYQVYDDPLGRNIENATLEREFLLQCKDLSKFLLDVAEFMNSDKRQNTVISSVLYEALKDGWEDQIDVLFTKEGKFNVQAAWVVAIHLGLIEFNKK